GHASRRPAATEGHARRGARPRPRHVRAGPDVRGARQPDPARPQGLPRAAPRPRRLPAAHPLPLRGPQGALIEAPILRAMFLGGAAGAPRPAAPRILLVDDDGGLLVPLAEQLSHDGFEVT